MNAGKKANVDYLCFQHPGRPACYIAFPDELVKAAMIDGARFFSDDFNYGELIAGDGTGISHALHGIFDPIAPVAAKALSHLAKGEAEAYRDTIAPTVALSRELFRAPPQSYKAGVVFLAWLNGHQDHFSMAGGMESARSILHFAQVFRKADACGVLLRPELAIERMKAHLRVRAGQRAKERTGARLTQQRQQCDRGDDTQRMPKDDFL